MDQQARDATTFLLGTLLTTCIIVGLLVRYVLLPYLRDHLIGPVQETHRQVTENHHRNSPPTLPDRIEDLAVDVRTLTRVVDRHLSESDNWSRQQEHRLERLASQVNGETDEQNPTT